MKKTADEAIRHMITRTRQDQQEAAKKMASSLTNLEWEIKTLRGHLENGFTVEVGYLLGNAKNLQDAADAYKEAAQLLTELEYAFSLFGNE